MFPSKTPSERRADFIIHAISLVGFGAAGLGLIVLAMDRKETGLIAAIAIYFASVMFSIGISFAYHLLPRHDLRPVLRRWDHAAIYPVIAGTFSPLLLLAGTWSASIILVIVWALALIGIIFKLIALDMDPRWSVASYLGLGAIGLLALPDFWSELPIGSSIAIGAGAFLYTVGTWFYRQKEMPFRYPIWHAWGTMGGGSLCAAIWIAVAD
ncbi:MAG: hemolysin III family protein [Pseudomonadota bacterium]